ncbi:hypothetical protein C8R48DRAFT_818693 [Suillus tomentosus]|nr:hypothetical protein C8R48DRAFT_818693 [Suillus tomentosus]
MQNFGTPSRVRGDRGGENLDVATYMIMRNGPRRASFMWGSFMLGTNSGQVLHGIRGSSVYGLKLTLFLDEINQDCSDFRAEWNCHPIRGPDTNDKSPKDLRFLGQIQFGVYRDDCEGVHPDVIEEHYGVHGPTTTRRQHQSGAGHPIDEEIIAEDITPCDCRLAGNEWEGDEYPIFKAIPVGRRGSKELHVSLAEPSWFNRARLWCQALLVLSYFLAAGQEMRATALNVVTVAANTLTRHRLRVANHWKFKRMNSLTDLEMPQLSSRIFLTESLVVAKVSTKSCPPPSDSLKLVYHLPMPERKPYRLFLPPDLLVTDRKDTMSSSSQPSKIGSQARRSTMSNLSTTGANTFRVASIALLTCGVDRNGLIRAPKAPTKNGRNEIQAMKNRGCYFDRPEQFIIDSGWSYHKITSQLRSWFPKVFDFLDIPVEKRPSAPSRSSAWLTQDEKPIWRLLNKSGQTLTVVDVAFPTGTDLMKHKGRDKASVITRNRIPDNVYELWNTQPVVAGSDSEHDDCSDVLLSDVDSLNDLFISKSDNELASSLMELELTDAEAEDPKGKGKMKVVSPKRTNMKRTRTVLSPEQSPSEVQRAIRKKKPANDVQAAIPLFLTESGPSTGSQPFPLTQLAQSNSLKTASFRSSPLGVPAGTAIQFLKSKSALSSPPEFVSVSEADVLWRS